MTTKKTEEGAVAPVTESSVAEMPGLSLLRAELEALAVLMPGLAPVLPAAETRTDAEIEADFDNMPV